MGSLVASGLVCLGLGGVAAGLSRAASEAGRSDALAGAVLVTRHDLKGEVVEVVRRDGAFAATPVAAFTGSALFERVLVTDRPAFLAAVRAAVDARAPVACAARIRCDGAGDAGPAFLPLDLRCSPFRGRGPKTGAAVEVVWREADAMRLKADAEALARARADEANAAKSRFLAAMSHELRTPLNAILGFSEILATEAGGAMDAGRKADYARIIHESGQHLLGLVNDILDLSRVEAGAYALEREQVDVPALVSGCAEMVAIDAARAGVRVRTHLPSGLPLLDADPRAVRQIVLNLVSNAVKFTPEGGKVQLSVRAQGGRLLLRVRDTGPGMRPEDVARLGEPFFQAGDLTQRARGSGLGIAVVKGLVKLHGGTFRVESAPGRGTSVSVTLPFAAPAAEVAAGEDDVVAFPARSGEQRLRRLA